jgi:hypothetical protein
MANRTEEEYAALDKKYSQEVPNAGANGTGFFSRQKAAHMVAIDQFTADYVNTLSAKTHQTPQEVLHDMVRREMAYA